jgi:hypothetical protein
MKSNNHSYGNQDYREPDAESTACTGFLFNAIYTLTLSPAYAGRLWQQVDLSALYQYDKSHYFTETTLIVIVAILRAILFYLIVKILYDKKLNLAQPFNKEVGRFILNVSYLSFGIGLFSFWGTRYTGWLITKGVNMPAIESLRIGGADVWLFMGVTLLVIGQIYKKGIEIQTENELTV